MTKLNYLVAVDNTEEADEVMAAARKLAEATGAQLSCVTVVRPVVQAYGVLDLAGYSQNLVELEDQAKEMTKRRLDSLAAEYHISPNDIYIRNGNPAIEIRNLAEELGSDMIVIGTHARHGLGILLGSTANAVLHGIGCDAMVVKVH